MCHLLNVVGILVTADTDKAFLALVFTASASKASVFEGLVQEEKKRIRTETGIMRKHLT